MPSDTLLILKHQLGDENPTDWDTIDPMTIDGVETYMSQESTVTTTEIEDLLTQAKTS